MAADETSQLLTLALWAGLGVLFALVILSWLKVSRSKVKQSHPHMHVVDGVTITHSHAGGELDHQHSTITVSMQHYAHLVKRAERRQSS
mgnify:CR=1 FL=1